MIFADQCEGQVICKLNCILVFHLLYNYFFRSASTEVNVCTFVSIDSKFVRIKSIGSFCNVLANKRVDPFSSIDNLTVICEHCYFALRASIAKIIFFLKGIGNVLTLSLEVHHIL